MCRTPSGRDGRRVGVPRWSRVGNLHRPCVTSAVVSGSTSAVIRSRRRGTVPGGVVHLARRRDGELDA